MARATATLCGCPNVSIRKSSKMSWKLLHLVQAFLLIAASARAAEPEAVEPPLKYTLFVDGKATDISEGKPVRLSGEFKNPEVTLKVDPHRVFTYAGISFRFPQYYTFEADLTDKEARTWTLSGNDAKVMIADLQGDVSLPTYAEAVSENVGKGALKILDRKLKAKFGEHTLSGMSTKVNIGTVESSMDFYLISTTGGRTRFLIVMDGYLNSGHTKEGDTAIKLLKESFAIKRK